MAWGGSRAGWARHWHGQARGARFIGGLLARHADALVVAAVLGVVASMIVPLPPAVLDVLLSGSLTLAVVILALALEVRAAFDLSTLPTLLLLTTLFRLGLEISATRLVLLHGHAGAVIHAFGTLVVGGNLVVGAVIFLILTLVQYVVITKGAERVAEVAARFTLDGMPGKQMAIDADLRAGSIDLAGAGRRRAELDEEAQLFGAMDGAIKFVRGDAVAGLVILAVNLVGGLAVGIWQRGMTLEDALRTYAVLTVGGGLAAQVPALVISVAAGILVTRNATRGASEPERRSVHDGPGPDRELDGGGAGDLADRSGGERAATGFGGELLRQLGQQPKAIAVGGSLLLALALVPGLPTAPFALLGLLTCGLAARQTRARAATRARARAAGPDPILYQVTRPITVRSDAAGSSGGAGGEAMRLAALSETISRRFGLELARLELSTTHGGPWLGDELVMDGVVRAVGRAPSALPAAGQAPPASGAARTWVDAAANLLAGLLPQLVSVDDTAAWLERWRRTHPALVRETVPKVLSLARLNDVLRGLVREAISLRGGVDILESLATLPPSPSASAGAADPAAAVEHVRSALGTTLVAPHLDVHGRLPVVELESQIEDALRDGLRQLGQSRQLALEPALADDIVAAIRKATETGAIPGTSAAVAGTAVERGAQSPPRAPVVLTHKDLRRHLHQLLESVLPGIAVVAYSELPPSLILLPVGRARVLGPRSEP